MISKINTNKNSNNSNTPTEVLSAADVFSEGMKRNLASIVTANDSEKKQCVRFNENSSGTNGFEVEITKSQQTRSVSSISGLLQVTDSAERASMNQCNESWMQRQHCFQMEKNQNKEELKCT